MSNEELVRQIQQGNDTEALQQLYDNNIGLIHKLACKYRGYAELEDLKQEAFFGLYEAVKRYEFEKEVKFITFAASWIKRAMLRYIETCERTIRLPNHMEIKLRKYTLARNERLEQTGKEPTDMELCRLLKMDRKALEKVKTIYTTYQQIKSLDSENTNAEGEDRSIDVASGEDIEEQVIDRLIKQGLQSELWEIVRENTNHEESEVICCRYQENLTMEKTGERLGIESHHVRRLQEGGLRKLRTGRIRRILEDKFDIAIQGAYRGNLSSFRYTWTSSTERAAMKLL